PALAVGLAPLGDVLGDAEEVRRPPVVADDRHLAGVQPALAARRRDRLLADVDERAAVEGAPVHRLEEIGLLGGEEVAVGLAEELLLVLAEELLARAVHRSEERRVGKEWRSRWSPYDEKKKDRRDMHRRRRK